jgi:hypothetical protein
MAVLGAETKRAGLFCLVLYGLQYFLSLQLLAVRTSAAARMLAAGIQQMMKVLPPCLLPKRTK